MQMINFDFQGQYFPFQISASATQEDVEVTGRDYFKGNVALIELPVPSLEVSYRNNSVWTKRD
jgi:hypothetical protein